MQYPSLDFFSCLILCLFAAQLCYGTTLLQAEATSSATLQKRMNKGQRRAVKTVHRPSRHHGTNHRHSEHKKHKIIPSVSPEATSVNKPIGTYSKIGSTTMPESSHSATKLSGRYTGPGTNWKANWKTGNCAFVDWQQPKQFGAVAMASNLWANSEICGACLNITGPGGAYFGIVMDQCPSCKPNGLDLDNDIWDELSGGQNPGIIDLSWQIISCGFSKPICVVNKIGASSYFTSIQVNEANAPIKSLEVMPQGQNTWVVLERKSESDFFQPSNYKGLGNFGTVRITCINGKEIIIENVDIASPDKTTEGKDNC
ncbi:hypothetical protein O181_010750 [Austropuccinia psidii MF-1]|uniref:Expansin-like EG45 domain-containing protein n=1 Tax=Austropuccinia psidii MF-1 TaxID=1389203 RepID=A0A9Q3BTU7_9BASI|nr:hypothetical protein [Austropuccinia psidii MF-1]